MDTHTTLRINSSNEEEADMIAIRYQPIAMEEGKTVRFLRPLLKWFGTLSTIALGTAALAPHVLNVPMQLRPWVFLTFIFWFFAFCAGTFNL